MAKKKRTTNTNKEKQAEYLRRINAYIKRHNLNIEKKYE
jgi:hypothetical protein